MRILITGGNSDIAKAIARRRLSMNDEVIITASSEDSLKKALESYEQAHLKVEGVVFNLGSPDVSALQPQLKKGIDAVIFNAFERVSELKKIHELSEGYGERYLQNNIVGNFALVRAVLPTFLEKKFGRFVLISSLSAASGTSRYGVYCAAKASLEGLFLNLAVDYAGEGILSNIARLGLFKTSRTALFWKRSEYREKMATIIPQQILGEPDQAAEALDALLSPTSYINGATLNVSGGLPLLKG